MVHGPYNIKILNLLLSLLFLWLRVFEYTNVLAGKLAPCFRVILHMLMTAQLINKVIRTAVPRQPITMFSRACAWELNQIYPSHRLIPYFCQICFNVHPSISRSPEWLLLLIFSILVQRCYLPRLFCVTTSIPQVFFTVQLITSSIICFSDYIRVFKHDDCRMERPKCVVEKELNDRTVFRCCVYLDIKLILITSLLRMFHNCLSNSGTVLENNSLMIWRFISAPDEAGGPP
jgi:hypothetical protein